MAIIELLDLESVAQTPWLSLWRMRYRHRGIDQSWDFASRVGDEEAQRRRLLDGQQKANAVTIAPFVKMPEGHGYGIVVIREFRPVLGGYEYSFPAGLIDNDESPEQAAIRELHEETGLSVKRFLCASPFIYSSAGSSDECLRMLFCEAEGQPTNTNAEAHEEIEICIFSLASLGELALGLGDFQGAMHGARSWPVLYMLYCMSRVMSSEDIFRCMI